MKPSLRKLVAVVLSVIACTAYTVAAFVEASTADTAERPTVTESDAPLCAPVAPPARATCTS